MRTEINEVCKVSSVQCEEPIRIELLAPVNHQLAAMPLIAVFRFSGPLDWINEAQTGWRQYKYIDAYLNSIHKIELLFVNCDGANPNRDSPALSPFRRQDQSLRREWR